MREREGLLLVFYSCAAAAAAAAIGLHLAFGGIVCSPGGLTRNGGSCCMTLY